MLPLLTQGGGAEKYFTNLARNLSNKGYKTDVITMNESFFKIFARLLHIFTHGNFFRKIDISGRETEIVVKNRLGNSNWIKSSFINLRKVLGQYDIIYSKNEIVDLLLLKLIGYRKLPPIIIGVHTSIFYPNTKSFNSKLHNFLYLSSFYKWLLRGARCIHLSNKFTKNLVDEKFDIKSELIYYPFSLNEITAAIKNVKSPMEFNPHKKNIAFVGRLAEQKGIASLVNIIERIAKKEKINKKIVFNIFGSGDKKNEKIINDLQKKYFFVKWHGHIENKYILKILSQQDLFISTAKWETLPFNILEAQVVGLPVIAFSIPGPKDIIINGTTGLLVNDDLEFCSEIEDCILGRKVFDSKVITDNIKEKFSSEKIYSEIIAMFQKYLTDWK